jgi:hypothetical protein
MGQPILSEQTVEALKECVLEAEERHGFSLEKALRESGVLRDLDPTKVRCTFDGVLKGINWTDRNSILPIIPVFEDAYAESPKNAFSIHQKVDVSLARDGFRMRLGQLIRLPF